MRGRKFTQDPNKGAGVVDVTLLSFLNASDCHLRQAIKERCNEVKLRFDYHFAAFVYVTHILRQFLPLQDPRQICPHFETADR